jgi:zinc protease
MCDPKGKEGLTALTTQLIADGGTKKMSTTEVNKLIYPWAATIGSSTDKEVSIFTFQVPTQQLNNFYNQVVKEMILQPRMDTSDFQRHLSNQKNYVDQVIRESSDEEFGKKYLEAVIYNALPYQHLVSGTSSGLKSITIEDVKKQYMGFYSRNNVTVGVAGDYPADFPDKVKADLEKLPDVVVKFPLLIRAPMPEGLNVTIISKPGALGSAISAGFPMSINRSDDDFAALMVANSWLGEHRKSYSRLYQKIREARSMNYGDYSYIEWYENGGSNMLPPAGTPRYLNYFSIWLRPVQTAKGLKKQYAELSDIKIGHAHYALRMALREMDNLVKNGMSASDFSTTVEFLRSYSKLYVETPAKRLGYLMDSRFYNRQDWINELDTLLSKVTIEDVNRVMKKYWQIQNMDIVIITDESEAEPLAKSLRANEPSPMVYSNDLKSTLPESILNEDKVVESFSIPVKNVTVISKDVPFR